MASPIGMTPDIAAFDGAAAEWDAAVERAPGWTAFHRYGWKRILEDVFGHECAYLVARAPDGTVGGVLPLVHVRSRWFGHYLVSMPFLNYGGPLGDDASVAGLVQHAVTMADASRAKLLELRSRTALPVPMEASHRKITVLLDLPQGDADLLWRQLGSKLRSQIKRPRKEGVTVRVGLDQVDPFFTVFSRHMRDLGTPALPRKFFHAVAQTFPDDVWFACAYHDGRPIAGGAGFLWGNEFEITWASALREHKRLAANMLVYWTLMERAVERGLSIFNFGRCTPGGGTHRFKRQWGGRDEQLWWYQAPGQASAPSPDQGVYRLATRMWQRLPVPLATALGPRIVRGIP